MTEDTKRALKIMEPIASVLEIDVDAYGNILFLDSQAIGIGLNSTYDTVMEMIGWIFLERYCKGWCPVEISKEEIDNTIKRHWVSKALLEKLIRQEAKDHEKVRLHE